jgi:hypothetical protein
MATEEKRMKYIDADKIKAEIKRIMAEEMEMFSEQCQGGEEPNAANAVVYTRMQMLLSFIDQMQQEEPLPPGIENESQKKGWLDYGLTMGEIGLHRYNAIHRIKEHKEQFNPLAIPDLYHVAEYYESVGAEKTCCCLQRYCMDFRFDQEDVREIISKEE